ncbi:MAG: hypothetical protein IDH49_08760 [Gammaproteobacteria bacterium]|nr:hypothetical protein [Gammaproteobacteria bacterium]
MENVSIVISLVAIALAGVAFVIAQRARQTREFNACEITFEVTDVQSGATQTFGLGSSSPNHTATRTTWIAKLTKDAVAQMMTTYPNADVHRLVVDVHSARFYDVAA